MDASKVRQKQRGCNQSPVRSTLRGTYSACIDGVFCSNVEVLFCTYGLFGENAWICYLQYIYIYILCLFVICLS